MKKLFNAIRHGDFDEVKSILETYPEAVNEAATPPPKKDTALSPLQVALKIGELDIAEYLIEHGADVNYIEPEDKVEEPVWRMPVIQDAIRAVFFAYDGIEPKPEKADKAAEIVRELLERGADPNALSWRTIEKFGERETNPDLCPIGECVSGVGGFVNSSNARNLERRDMAVEKFNYLMDLLLSHGADFEAWANRPPSAYHKPDDTARKRYIDDFVPVPDHTVQVIKRRYSIIPVNPDKPIELKKGDKLETIVIKGDVDHNAKMREFMREFCKKRNLL